MIIILLLTFYVFQGHRTSEYLAEYIYSIGIDVFDHTTIKVQILFEITKQKGCQEFSELFISTELPNNELTSIHTRDLPHLLL